VRATISKRRKEDVLPLNAAVAERLRGFLKRKPLSQKLWPGRWFRRAAEMLRDDLKAAGIAPKDEQGRTLDFHSVRHGFVTQLAVAGVQPKMAQALARHSTINLTMNVYSHVEQQALAGALDQALVRPFTRSGDADPPGKASCGRRRAAGQ
jgi:integrase